MTNKEIFYFAGKCLALDENPGFRTEIIDKSKSDLIDWQRFVVLCSDHLILPAIYLKFKSHDIIDYIPEELSEHLYEIYKLNVSRNNQILEQLHEITAVLNKNNIYPLFLKGAGNLLDGLYSNIGERILGDIDFLVSEKDYLISAELMKNTGYTKVSATSDYTDIKTLKHYPRLFHPDFIAIIEIHRIPIDENYQSWFNNEKIDREKITVSSLPGCYISSDHHRIIHNFIHSQLSNEGYLFGTVSLREIYDLFLLSKRFPLVETIPEIKTKQKAIAYFALARLVLGLDESFFPKRNFAFWILFRKHSLNLSSAIFYHVYRSIIFIAQRIFIDFFSLLIKSVYSKEKRQYLIKRMTNRNWYDDQVQLYTRFFKRNK